MVQKKVPNKLGIQADHVKSEKGLHNLISSPSQLHDSKNKGAELKKKMKKSRSIKRSDIESLRSIQQPGKPPPLDVQNSSPIPKKKSPSPIKAAEASPNYMKSTSSFEARKDRSSPVSLRNSQASIVSKTPSPKKINNLLKDKSARTLNRTSSLKLVRTLTKSPSFKPARTKCSPVALCEDLDIQRSTCSSTLKDTKFPTYLELDPGATEAQGTSAMKVCPYTYCSLNGHHHKPLTPLKCFLSARRRVLKTQKSVKLGCLSPRRANNSGVKVMVSEKAQVQEVGLDSLPISPVMQQEHRDFFVEIYTQDREGKEDPFSINENTPYCEVTAATENVDGKSVEPASNESQCLDIYFENDLDQRSDIISTEINITENFLEQDQSEEATEEVENPPRRQVSEPDSEASDMEWEAGQYSVPYLDDVPILESDEIVTTCFKEIMTDELLQGLFDEESVGSEAWFDDGESESGGSPQNLDGCDPLEQEATKEMDESIKPDETHIADPVEEEPKATSEDMNVVLEEINEIPRMCLQLVDDEAMCSGDLEVEALIDHLEENESPPNDYWCAFAENQDSDSSHDVEQSFLEQELPTDDPIDGVEEKEEVNDLKLLVGIQNFDSLERSSEAKQHIISEETDEAQIGAIFEEGESNQTPADKGLLDEIENHSSDQKSQNNNVVENESQYKKGGSEAEKFKKSDSTESEDQTCLTLGSAENRDQEAEKMEVECTSKSDEEETYSMAKNKFSSEKKKPLNIQRNSIEDTLDSCKFPKVPIRCKRLVEESEEERKFNPRDPNFLPVELDPEGEKVDLRHQMMDERKNAEEWMVDYALRRAVTDLAPARKRKVSLLVAAFETVMPVPKYETRLRHTSAAFSHSRPIQACR